MTDKATDDRIDVIERCACSLAVHDGRNWKMMNRLNKDIFIGRAKVVIEEYNRYASGD